jgi:hypothetical protein
VTKYFYYCILTTLTIAGCATDSVDPLGSSRFPGHEVELRAEMGDWATDGQGRLHLLAHDSTQGLCDDTVHINLGNEKVGLHVFLSPDTYRGVSWWPDQYHIVRDGVEGTFEDGAPVSWTPTRTGGVLEVTGSQWCTASGCVPERNVLTLEIEPVWESRDTVFHTCAWEGEPSPSAPAGNFCGDGPFPPRPQCHEVRL